MVGLEIAGVLVFAGLALATVYMVVWGGLGMLGAVHFVRCPHCGHLVSTPGTGPPERGAHCRHVEMLHHPLHVLHDVHAPRV